MMFNIIPATEEHISDITHIEEECFPVPWTEKQLADDIKSPATRYFVAVCDNTVCGYAGMWQVLDEGSITNIAVLKEYRNKGIASALLKEILASNVNYVTLEVRTTNTPAISLYEKHGFKPMGIRKGYYTNPDGTKDDAILMVWKNN